MQKNMKRILIGVALLSILLGASCGAAETKEPTPDVNAIKTEAVKTAMAEMTVQAALSPSKTAPPPTPLPTATLNTDAAQPAAGASAPTAPSTGGSGTSGTPIPTWTPDPYACEYVTEDPLDGPQMTGWNYDKTWTFRNVGTNTWTVADYYIKWDKGDDISPQHIYKIPHDVAPYETVVFTVDVIVPITPITEGVAYTDYWQLISDNGEVVCSFNNVITRTYPPDTKTPTPKP